MAPALRAAVALSLLSAATARPFDVVGWWVGDVDDSWPLESIRWDVYSTIRCGGVERDKATGKLRCPTSKTFGQCLAAARKHGKAVTLANGDFEITRCIYDAQKDPAVMKLCVAEIAEMGAAVVSCGPGVTGVEIDHESSSGLVWPRDATRYSEVLDQLQKGMGGNYTVGADVGSFGFQAAWGGGDTYPFETPWVDKAIFAANKNLFVNTMSYYWPKSCSIAAWKTDAFFMTDIWGLAKDQVNIGIGYFSYNTTGSKRKFLPKVSSEPTWHSLSKHPACQGLAPDVCTCLGTSFASPKMNHDIAAWVRAEGFRGVFPWAANYDSPDPKESRAVWVGRGLGLVPPLE